MSLRDRLRRLEEERGNLGPHTVNAARQAWMDSKQVPDDLRLRKMVWGMERFLIATASASLAGDLTVDEVATQLAQLDAAFGVVA